MKRFLIILIALAIFISLPGCALGQKSPEESVPFYYLRKPDDYLYGASDGVVTFENRDPSGHSGDIRYLLTLYLQGPIDEGLISPFPTGCALVDMKQSESTVSLSLNYSFATLKGIDLTLACVCLARTCIALTGADTVCITARSADGSTAISETITIDSLLPEDSIIPSESSS